MKKIAFLTTAIFLFLTLASCAGGSDKFTVEMTEARAQVDPIAMTVTLPDNAKESDITFTINEIVYSVSSIPTVDDPAFVFADADGDGMQSIMFTLYDEVGSAELHIITEDGAKLNFCADIEAFSRLTDYLRTN